MQAFISNARGTRWHVAGAHGRRKCMLWPRRGWGEARQVLSPRARQTERTGQQARHHSSNAMPIAGGQPHGWRETAESTTRITRRRRTTTWDEKGRGHAASARKRVRVTAPTQPPWQSADLIILRRLVHQLSDDRREWSRRGWLVEDAACLLCGRAVTHINGHVIGAATKHRRRT